MKCFFIYLTIVILFASIIAQEDEFPCLESLSIDISDGEKFPNGSIFKNNTEFTSENYYEYNSITWGCICNIRDCIQKCCGPDEVRIDKKCTATKTPIQYNTLTFYDDTTVAEDVSPSDFWFIYAKRCPTDFIMVPNSNSSSDLELRYLQRNGSLYIIFKNTNYEDSDLFEVGYYCFELIDNQLDTYFCDYSPVDEEMNGVYITGMIISMPFLLVTFLVYLVLPDSNIHRKALMFYVMSLLIAYICLVSVQLYKEKIEPPSCEALGLCVVYFFLVSFFWMNVMCIDIFLAFRGLRGFTGKKSAETKRFLLYCLYALGLPTLHVLLLLTLNRVLDEKSVYSPQIGVTKCFLEDGIPNLLYFYGPMGVLLTINIILFILTAIKIQQVKKETSMLKHSDSKRHSYENDKQKFNLYVKLLLAMGVNWIMEIISWAFIWKMGQEVPNSVWYLTDFVNAMYGVLIFFIFVFKRKIWKSLQKRYYVFIGKPHLAHSTTMTQTTRSSNYSTTDTGLNEHRLSELRNGRAEERALTAS